MADIEIEYFRGLYPMGPNDITLSPNGHPITLHDWSYNAAFQLEIEETLKKIKEQHGINYKISIVGNEYLKEMYPQYKHVDLYKIFQEFLKSAEKLRLRKRTGFEEELCYKNKYGGKEFSIVWCLIIRINGNIEWYERYYWDIPSFLFYLLREGPDWLIDWIEKKEWNLVEVPGLVENMEFKGTSWYENNLLRKLIESGVLGDPYSLPKTEEPVGDETYYGEYSYWTLGSRRKRIDLLFNGQDCVWIVEAKVALDWTAIGQVFGYKQLLKRDWKKYLERKELPEIKLGIVCEYTDPEIERCCEDLGISIWPSYELDKLKK